VRSHKLHRRLLGATAALTLAASAGVASAQQTAIALDRFDPAPAGDRMFGVPSPYVAGHLTPHVMLLGDYAHNPLVLRWTGTGERVGTVVGNQLFLHLNGGLALWNRLYVGVDVPVAVFQDGGSPNVGGQMFTSPSKAQFGDLRIDLRVRLFGEYHDPFQIGVGGYVWVPTAPHGAGSFVGDGKVRGLPQLLVGGRVAERFIYSAALGPELRATESIGGVNMGSMFKWGAGAGVLLLDNRHLQLNVEATGSVSFKDMQKRNTNAELLAGIRYRVIDDLEIGAGAGPGLSSGIGTPDVRAVFMIAYTPEQKLDRDGDGILDAEDACPDVKGVRDPDPKKNGCPPPSDRDGDGIVDEVDACPDVKGVADPDPKKNGCPPPSDRDGDGIVDEVDACPDVKGVADPDPKKNGCPPDRDGDGIIDAEDACPDVKGVRDPDPKKNGCPPPVDTDGDGIFDNEDACPNEKGVRDPDPTKNGCPKAVRVSETEIFILEQVQFDTAKSTIKKVSDPLLDEVAGVLKEHPEIARIEVQGHTDNRGVPAMNKTLSQARADAVMKALIKRGIDGKRLTAKGYGQDKPIATNDTDDGRQKNRRVQFTILEKRPKGASAEPPPPPPPPKAPPPPPKKTPKKK
jgi:outer membrane protein OmpA-like peptidoglycan-associated protein